MKRVLLISYYYPPRQGVGGVRAGGLAKYLPQFNWEPIIFTPKLPPGNRPPARVIETGYRDVLSYWKARMGFDPTRGFQEQLQLPQSQSPRSYLMHTRAIYWLKSLITYPDPSKGWLPFARQALLQFATQEHVDAIVSSAPPMSSHLVGVEAGNILQCPWVADCRDMLPDAPFGSRLLRKRLRSLERRTLQKADALVTVSAPWADHLRRQHPSKSVVAITNGFDPDEVVGCKRTATFSITYTGQLYDGERDPTLLFEVLGELIRENVLPSSIVRVRFYGSPDPWLAAQIERNGLREVVEIHGSVSRRESLQHQRESQILLLLGINVPMYEGGYPAKLFEYLAARRPIIALGGRPGVVGQLLAETGTGMFVVSKTELRAFLVSAYAEFCGCAQVAYRGDPTAIAQYTHQEMARKFAQTLDNTLETQACSRSMRIGSRMDSLGLVRTKRIWSSEDHAKQIKKLGCCA
jgi:glycosyltransferase involved in cell wall biosynthesis